MNQVFNARRSRMFIQRQIYPDPGIVSPVGQQFGDLFQRGMPGRRTTFGKRVSNIRKEFSGRQVRFHATASWGACSLISLTVMVNRSAYSRFCSLSVSLCSEFGFRSDESGLITVKFAGAFGCTPKSQT